MAEENGTRFVGNKRAIAILLLSWYWTNKADLPSLIITMKSLVVLTQIAASFLPAAVIACGDDSCYGPTNTVEHVRHVKRIQPGAPEAQFGPKGPLEWGQINFMHTVSITK